MHIYPCQIDPNPWSIEHRCLEYCYTKVGRSNGRSTGTCTPQLSIDALKTATPTLADLVRSIGRSTPLPIEQRCLEYHYTKLGRTTADLPPQTSIDALNTATPNLADLLSDRPPQTSIDALNTTTPNLADPLADLPPIN